MRYYDYSGDGQVVVGVLALACCVVEVDTALADRRLVETPPPDARMIVVAAGTLTDALTPLVQEAVAAHPGATVIAFGACASAGGPYWDSPVVTKGVDQIVNVDYYVPGCPPTPSALLAVVEEASHAHMSDVGHGPAETDRLFAEEEAGHAH